MAASSPIASAVTARAATADPPFPPGNFLVGNAGQILQDGPEFLLQAHANYGDAIRLRLGSQTAYALFHPDHVYHVLVKHRQNYTKQSPGYQKIRQVVGNGLIASEGDFWLRQRRLAQPAFAAARLAGFAERMVAATAEMSDSWQILARSAAPFDVAHEFMKLTMRIVGETLLGTDVTADASDIGALLTLVLDEVTRRMFRPWSIPERLPLPANRRFDRALQSLRKAVQKIIDEHRRDANRPDDLLTMLMSACDDESGTGMSDQHLSNEVLTFFIAGHETTAKVLTWTFYLLSQHVEVRRRWHDELDNVLAGRLPTAADLARLPYTRQVIQESMRLYPPAWEIPRLAEADDVLADVRIRAGSTVFLVPYVTHRHRAFWDNPAGFDPDRFSPERAAGQHPYAYFPFGAGPRICIGNHFAMLEAVMIMATIGTHWSVNLVPGHPVELEASVTLRPKHGLWTTLVRR